MSRITIEELRPELYVRIAPIASAFSDNVFCELYRAVMMPEQTDIDAFIDGNDSITVIELAELIITESLDALASSYCAALSYWEDEVLVPKGQTRFDH